MFKEAKNIVKYLAKNKERLKNKDVYPEDLLTRDELIILIDYILSCQSYIKKVKESRANNNE